jgi:hypothetical protein
MEQRGRGANTVSFPSMRQGEVAICLATLLARANPKGKSPMLDFRNQGYSRRDGSGAACLLPNS